MADEEEVTMDRAYHRLRGLIEVLRFIERNWQSLENPAQVLDVATCELANAVTPAVMWRETGHTNGVIKDGNE